MKKLIALVFSLLAWDASADTKISALPTGSAITGTELVPVVQGGTTIQTTPAAFFTPAGDLGGTRLSQTLIQASALTGNLTTAAAATVTSNGRNTTLAAGPGGSTSGNGGALTLTAGTVTAGTGGSASLIATDGVGTNKNGGSVTLQAGAKTGTGTYGQINFGLGTGGLALQTDSFGTTFTLASTTSGGSIHVNANDGAGSFIVFTASDEVDTVANQINFTTDIGFNISSAADGANYTWLFGTGSNWEVDSDTILFVDSTGSHAPQHTWLGALVINTDNSVTTEAATANTGGSFQTPSTGFTITIANATTFLNLDPSGTLLAGTINLPAAPIDGQIVEVSSTQTVTTLTVSGNGHTIKNAPTTIAAGTGFSYRYHLANTTWYRRY